MVPPFSSPLDSNTLGHQECSTPTLKSAVVLTVVRCHSSAHPYSWRALHCSSVAVDLPEKDSPVPSLDIPKTLSVTLSHPAVSTPVGCQLQVFVVVRLVQSQGDTCCVLEHLQVVNSEEQDTTSTITISDVYTISCLSTPCLINASQVAEVLAKWSKKESPSDYQVDCIDCSVSRSNCAPNLEVTKTRVVVVALEVDALEEGFSLHKILLTFRKHPSSGGCCSANELCGQPEPSGPPEPPNCTYKSSESLNCTYKSLESSNCTYKSSESSNCTYKSSESLNCTYKSSVVGSSVPKGQIKSSEDENPQEEEGARVSEGTDNGRADESSHDCSFLVERFLEVHVKEKEASIGGEKSEALDDINCKGWKTFQLSHFFTVNTIQTVSTFFIVLRNVIKVYCDLHFG